MKIAVGWLLLVPLKGENVRFLCYFADCLRLVSAVFRCLGPPSHHHNGGDFMLRFEEIDAKLAEVAK